MHQFQLQYPQYLEAESVYVVGTFNNWLNVKEGVFDINEVAKLWQMQKSPAGWLLEKSLPAGSYEFKFCAIDSNHNIKWIGDDSENNFTLNIETSSGLQLAC